MSTQFSSSLTVLGFFYIGACALLRPLHNISHPCVLLSHDSAALLIPCIMSYAIVPSLRISWPNHCSFLFPVVSSKIGYCCFFTFQLALSLNGSFMILSSMQYFHEFSVIANTLAIYWGNAFFNWCKIILILWVIANKVTKKHVFTNRLCAYGFPLQLVHTCSRL